MVALGANSGKTNYKIGWTNQLFERKHPGVPRTASGRLSLPQAGQDRSTWSTTWYSCWRVAPSVACTAMPWETVIT